MSLALVSSRDTSSVPLSSAALSLVTRPKFLYLANFYLDSGKTAEQTALLLQGVHHDAFHRSLRRAVNAHDVLLAKQVLAEQVPSAALRFEMTKWALTLSKQFRRVAGQLTGNKPTYSQDEADQLTEYFQSYLSARTYNSGYCFKCTILPDDVNASFMLYPEGMQGPAPETFRTAEAALFEWCRLVPFRQHDRSLAFYAKYFGDKEIIDTLLFRCNEACALPLPSFMSEEQKAEWKNRGNACFWHMADYINWLTHDNPLDHQ